VRHVRVVEKRRDDEVDETTIACDVGVMAAPA